jgi:hypothetical protein
LSVECLTESITRTLAKGPTLTDDQRRQLAALFGMPGDAK